MENLFARLCSNGQTQKANYVFQTDEEMMEVLYQVHRILRKIKTMLGCLSLLKDKEATFITSLATEISNEHAIPIKFHELLPESAFLFAMVTNQLKTMNLDNRETFDNVCRIATMLESLLAQK